MSEILNTARSNYLDYDTSTSAVIQIDVAFIMALDRACVYNEKGYWLLKSVFYDIVNCIFLNKKELLFYVE